MSLLQDGLGVHIKLPDRRCIGGDGLRLMVPLLDELGGYLGEQGQLRKWLIVYIKLKYQANIFWH